MGAFYCARSDITELLEALTGSPIASDAQQDAKLRRPATAWIDSVYPDLAPFSALPDNDPTGWLVNQSDHDIGDATVTIDGGSGNPAAGDLFRPVLAHQWSTADDDINPRDTDTRTYRVTAYASNVVSYEPVAEDVFPDNAAVIFGPPELVRQACRYYGAGIALQILRKNPEDPLVLSYLSHARTLLQIAEGGTLAKARPDVTYDVALSGAWVIA